MLVMVTHGAINTQYDLQHRVSVGKHVLRSLPLCM